jgi:hypothetical protein
MSFFRHREIFQPDVIRLIGERPSSRSPAHRLDEFPVGYSSASCTPAALASASPTGIHSAIQACRRQRSFQPMANSALTFCVTPGDNRKMTLKIYTKGERVLRIEVILYNAREYCWGAFGESIASQPRSIQLHSA